MQGRIGSFGTVLFAALCLLSQVLCAASQRRVELEIAGGNVIGVWFNGQKLQGHKGINSYSYTLLTSSEGVLPLGLYRSDGTNVVAIGLVHQAGTEVNENSIADARSVVSGFVCGRLRVGSPGREALNIFMTGENTRYFKPASADKAPAGWQKAEFNDEAWTAADTVYHENYPRLMDPEAPDMPGAPLRQITPFITLHTQDSFTSSGEVALFRFKFNKPFRLPKAGLAFNPAQPKAGDTVAVRVIPDKAFLDTEGNCQVVAVLPAGLDYVKAADNGQYFADKRLVVWTYPASMTGMKTAKANIKAVVDAKDWITSEKALGGWKERDSLRAMFKNPNGYFEGAAFFPGHGGWYEMDPVAAPAIQPEIEGVVFHFQVIHGFTSNLGVVILTSLRMNYSVNGQNQGLLPQEAPLGVQGFNQLGWADGYYDASFDRKWTWADLAHLRVCLQADTLANRSKNLLAGGEVVVRYHPAGQLTPAFFAKVTEKGAKTLEVRFNVAPQGMQLAGMESYSLPVNQNPAGK